MEGRFKSARVHSNEEKPAPITEKDTATSEQPKSFKDFTFSSLSDLGELLPQPPQNVEEEEEETEAAAAARKIKGKAILTGEVPTSDWMKPDESFASKTEPSVFIRSEEQEFEVDLDRKIKLADSSWIGHILLCKEVITLPTGQEIHLEPSFSPGPPKLKPQGQKSLVFNSAKEDLQHLENEMDVYSQETAGLHGGVREELEEVIAGAQQTITHGGTMDVNEAIKYNQKLLAMQEKFEILSVRLHKARAELAKVKGKIEENIRMGCRCWWCRSTTFVRVSTSSCFRGITTRLLGAARRSNSSRSL